MIAATYASAGTLDLGRHLGISDSDAQILYFAAGLLLTLALTMITAYYAVQNKRMADEMRRQSRPYVYLVQEGGQLKIRNSGNRTAHHVKIEVVRDANMAEGEFRQVGENTVLGLAKFGSAEMIREGVRTLSPDAERVVGRFARPAPTRRVHVECRVSYQDGSGLSYAETLYEEYRV